MVKVCGLLVFTAIILSAWARSSSVPTPSSFDFVRSLVQEDMLLLNPRVNASQVAFNSTHVNPLIQRYFGLILDEDTLDLGFTRGRVMILRTNALKLSSATFTFQNTIANLTARIEKLREESKPTPELSDAVSQANLQRNTVHKLHRQCKCATSDIDKQIHELQKRLEEVDFIRNTIANGADPDVVGRLVRRYGTVSDLHNNIERTLLHMMSLQEQAKDSTDAISKVVAFLELEAVPVDTWSESISNILSSMKSSLSNSLYTGSTQASFASGMITSYFQKMWDSVPSMAAAPPASNPSVADSKADLAGQLQMLMQEGPKAAVTPVLVGVPTTVSYILEPVSLDDLRLMCEKSVLFSANDGKSLPATNETEMVSALSLYFKRKVEGSQLAIAFVKSVLTDSSAPKFGVTLLLASVMILVLF